MSLVFYFWDLIQEVFTDISALGKLVFLVVFTGFCGSSDTNSTKTFFLWLLVDALNHLRCWS